MLELTPKVKLVAQRSSSPLKGEVDASAASRRRGVQKTQINRTNSTPNLLSLSIASDVSTTNSFYGAYACKNWVLASGRDAERKRGREGISKILINKGANHYGKGTRNLLQN